MVFVALAEAHIPEAIALAEADFARESACIPALANADVSGTLADQVAGVIRDGIAGIAAMDGDRLAGYLAFYGPIPGFFGTVDGAFSPLHGHATGGADRERLSALILQHAMTALADRGITSLAITAYAHDEEVSRAFQLDGFGIRNADAIRDLAALFPFAPVAGVTCRELTGAEIALVAPLENALRRHLRLSPTFFPAPDISEDAFMARQADEGARFFGAWLDGVLAGYVKVSDEGENFITTDPGMPNISGAYLVPEHRGRGVYDSLVAFTSDVLRDEGARLLGVDFETLNPTALHFWAKYFDIYTYSHARRIDERTLEFLR
jgi:GNAT superfamily N-acetyltransferase